MTKCCFNNHNCQFDQFFKTDQHYEKYDCQEYCIYHLPVEAKHEWDTNKITFFIDTHNKLIDTYLNFWGSQFPHIKKEQGHICLASPEFKYNLKNNENETINSKIEFYSYLDCTFSGGARLDTNNATQMISIIDSTFGGSVEINLKNDANLKIKSTKFNSFSKFISDENYNAHLAIDNCSPKGNLNFTKFRTKGPIYIRNCKFKNPPNFDGCMFSQGSIFQNIDYGKNLTVGFAGSFRHMRKEFSEKHSRYYEGTFYALEQRCERQAFPWYHASRLVSTLYDWVSEYGLSFERAGIWLIGVQAFFLFLYTFLLPRGYEITVGLWQFYFAQLFTPFKLNTLKDAPMVVWEKTEFITRTVLDNDTQVKMIVDYSPSLTWITPMHSFITLILTTMFILALRWRYKRG